MFAVPIPTYIAFDCCHKLPALITYTIDIKTGARGSRAVRGARGARQPQEAFGGLERLERIEPDQARSGEYRAAYEHWKEILNKTI